MTSGGDIPLQGVLGIIAIIGFAWLSGDRKALSWRVVAIGLGLQFLLAGLLLKVGPFQQLLLLLNRGISAVIRATGSATAYVFGYIGGAEPPFAVTNADALGTLAFTTLPVLLVMSVLSALLWHWRIVPLLVNGFARLLQKSFGLSGEVGFGAAANIFFGMIESPMLLRAYLHSMSRNEMFILMTCGMATVAGTVMGLYASLLTGVIDNPLSHILVASVISAPAAIMLALVMRPLDDTGSVSVDTAATRAAGQLRYAGNLDAIIKGTQDGVKVLVSVVATLIVFVALAALADEILSLLPAIAGEPVTLARIFGTVFAPLMWLIGIPWAESVTAGQLMGTKTIVNEFLAFIDLSGTALSDHSRHIMTYALCGFANLGSLGIMLAGLITMCPERSREFMAVSPWSIWSGTLATCLTAAIAGLVL